ncbi:MAG: protein kinase [Verrucomicrobiota bacterium]
MPDHSQPSSGPTKPHHSFVPPSVEELAAQFPRYDIIELIGHGGMGAVYKARQSKLDRFVAIKVLPKNLGADQAFAERFEREAQAMAKLHHSRIVTVHDFGETANGYLYIVMEFVRGTTLLDLIKNDNLENAQILAIVTQICDALQYAHKHGVIHRDIKPANIMLDVEGQVKVADFGLAKLADSIGNTITQTNVALGTPNYVAPEALVLNTEVDQRADIFAVGVLIYEMLTGKIPRGVFVPPSNKSQDIDPRLDDVVMRAMQAEPNDRYQQITQLWTDVDRIRTTPAPAMGTPVPAPGAVPKEPLSKSSSQDSPAQPKPRLALVAGLIIVLATTAVWIFASKYAVTPSAAKYTPSDDDPGKNMPEAKSPVETPSASTKPKDPGSSKNHSDPPAAAHQSAEAQREQMRRRIEAAIKARPENTTQKRPGDPRPSTRRPSVTKLRERPRQTSGNVLITRVDGGPIAATGLANLPADLDRVVDIQISQNPPWNDEDTPFAVALLADGSLRVWGTDDPELRQIPENLGQVTKIAVGLSHILALSAEGSIVAWGHNAAGQCLVPEGLSNVVEIAAGGQHSVALLRDGSVVTWGADSEDSYNQPPELLSQGGFTSIQGKGMHSLALHQDGTVIAWGDPDHGVTEPPIDLDNVTAITSTWNTAAALLENGKVVIWGAESIADPVPSESVVEIQSTIDSLLLRTQSGRWIIRAPDSSPIAFPQPAFGRQATRIVPADEYLFAFYAPDADIASEDGPADSPMNPLASTSEGGTKLAELIEKFRFGYTDTLLKSHLETVNDLDEKYLAAIDREQVRASEAGDLDSALAFRTETERIVEERPLPPVDPPDLPLRLIELRNTYREQIAILDADLAENALSLIPPFQNALDGMENEFTRAQQLDDALLIRNAREELAAKGLVYFLGAAAPATSDAGSPLDEGSLLDSLEDDPLPFTR